MTLHRQTPKNPDSEFYEKYKSKLWNHYTTLLNSSARFGLFIDNQELVLLANKLIGETLSQLVNPGLNFLLNIIHKNSKIEIEEKEKPESSPSKIEILKLKNKSEQYQILINELLEGQKIIAPQAVEFQRKCRKYLYDIIQNNDNNLEQRKIK